MIEMTLATDGIGRQLYQSTKCAGKAGSPGWCVNIGAISVIYMPYLCDRRALQPACYLSYSQCWSIPSAQEHLDFSVNVDCVSDLRHSDSLQSSFLSCSFQSRLSPLTLLPHAPRTSLSMTFSTIFTHFPHNTINFTPLSDSLSLLTRHYILFSSIPSQSSYPLPDIH